MGSGNPMKLHNKIKSKNINQAIQIDKKSVKRQKKPRIVREYLLRFQDIEVQLLPTVVADATPK